MLDARQLAQLTSDAASLLDLSGIEVQRATRTADNYGAYSETWATTATVAGGWAKPSASVMQQYAGLIGSLAAWVVRLPSGTSVRNGDRLVMPAGVGGQTLTIQADLTQSSYSTCVRVLATEVR